MLRVISGKFRGRRLASPRGRAFRPATGRVKEYIFNVLGERTVGAKVLDLFAGTGSLGIEALSRGAGEVVFIERSAANMAILENNVALCNSDSCTRIVRGDVFRELIRYGRSSERFDILLADPPFKDALHAPIVEAVFENRVITPGGWLVIEHEIHDAGVQQLRPCVRQRRFGSCVVSIYEGE